MKNKIFIVTPSQLNTNNVIETSTELIVIRTSDNDPPKNFTYYPLAVRIDNNSGVDVKFNIIDNITEYEEYLKGESYYQLLPLNKGNFTFNTVAGTPYKILIQKNSGFDASGNVNIYAVNYTQRF